MRLLLAAIAVVIRFGVGLLLSSGGEDAPTRG